MGAFSSEGGGGGPGLAIWAGGRAGLPSRRGTNTKELRELRRSLARACACRSWAGMAAKSGLGAGRISKESPARGAEAESGRTAPVALGAGLALGRGDTATSASSGFGLLALALAWEGLVDGTGGPLGVAGRPVGTAPGSGTRALGSCPRGVTVKELELILWRKQLA